MHCAKYDECAASNATRPHLQLERIHGAELYGGTALGGRQAAVHAAQLRAQVQGQLLMPPAPRSASLLNVHSDGCARCESQRKPRLVPL